MKELEETIKEYIKLKNKVEKEQKLLKKYHSQLKKTLKTLQYIYKNKQKGNIK